MVEGNTKPSICCGCHGWRMIALLCARAFYPQAFCAVGQAYSLASFGLRVGLCDLPIPK